MLPKCQLFLHRRFPSIWVGVVDDVVSASRLFGNNHSTMRLYEIRTDKFTSTDVFGAMINVVDGSFSNDGVILHPYNIYKISSLAHASPSRTFPLLMASTIERCSLVRAICSISASLYFCRIISNGSLAFFAVRE